MNNYLSMNCTDTENLIKDLKESIDKSRLYLPISLVSSLLSYLPPSAGYSSFECIPGIVITILYIPENDMYLAVQVSKTNEYYDNHENLLKKTLNYLVMN
ncbi:MAG: hypothetical protein N2749_01720 [Clostridia bacterium]|nr:hypothetical protein [Clostridia bacterium]